MSKQKTGKECKEEFLEHVAMLVDYWEAQNETSREKLEGLAFSILSSIDGESSELPGYALVPSPDEADKTYNLENGNDYYEYPPDINNGDIGGGLHELIHSYFRRYRGTFPTSKN